MAQEANRRSRLHPEMIVGVSAVFIGVCALIVSLYETRLMRQEQRAAVLPILELGRTLPAERDVVMFDLSDERYARAIVDQFDRLDFEACFCSMIEECWTASYSGAGGVEPVTQCRRDESSFLE